MGFKEKTSISTSFDKYNQYSKNKLSEHVAWFINVWRLNTFLSELSSALIFESQTGRQLKCCWKGDDKIITVHIFLLQDPQETSMPCAIQPEFSSSSLPMFYASSSKNRIQWAGLFIKESHKSWFFCHIFQLSKEEMTMVSTTATTHVEKCPCQRWTQPSSLSVLTGIFSVLHKDKVP